MKSVYCRTCPRPIATLQEPAETRNEETGSAMYQASPWASSRIQ